MDIKVTWGVLSFVFVSLLVVVPVVARVIEILLESNPVHLVIAGLLLVALVWLVVEVVRHLRKKRKLWEEERLQLERREEEERRKQQKRSRPPPSATAAALNQRLASVRHMSGSQFERFVADVMRGLGYRAQILGGSGDQGVDVIASRGGERLAIQCKQHDRPVGNKPVQEVFTGAKHHGCTEAMVVAPMGFTKGALALARSVGVSLHDAQSLRGWIRQIDSSERTLADSESSTVDLDEIDRTERTETDFEPRIVDLDKSDGAIERGAEKHTVKVGPKDSSAGETVSFTAELLGTVAFNGGADDGEDGWDTTYFRLPDGTFRFLVEVRGGVVLFPSNMVEAMNDGQRNNFSYGRMTLEEMKADSEYDFDFWEGYAALMKTRFEAARNIVDLDADSSEQKEEKEAESGMEKQTLSVGPGTLGETVRFTAEQLGTVQHNGGAEGGGKDITFYRLPDHTYRALVQRGDSRLLEPSNFSEVFGTDQPTEYGRWTLKELQDTEFYGEVFRQLMEVHPEGKKRNVRDLD